MLGGVADTSEDKINIQNYLDTLEKLSKINQMHYFALYSY